ncbi:hypothetical protein DRO35_02370 [Candidatus Bathyarchaeota archaeon]|nr:MAG: hypothetical protein DRO35_02370 [Candidatus Bathyarchaeota archaeon]
MQENSVIKGRNSMMVKVILDSNFFFIPFRFRIDIFEELNVLLGKAEPIVLSTTLDEMRKILKRSRGKKFMEFSAALKLAEKCEILKVEKETSEEYDDVILRVAKHLRIPVATNDAELRKKLRKLGLPTIYLREKSKLVIEGY